MNCSSTFSFLQQLILQKTLDSYLQWETFLQTRTSQLYLWKESIMNIFEKNQLPNLIKLREIFSVKLDRKYYGSRKNVCRCCSCFGIAAEKLPSKLFFEIVFLFFHYWKAIAIVTGSKFNIKILINWKMIISFFFISAVI